MPPPGALQQKKAWGVGAEVLLTRHRAEGAAFLGDRSSLKIGGWMGGFAQTHPSDPRPGGEGEVGGKWVGTGGPTIRPPAPPLRGVTDEKSSNLPRHGEGKCCLTGGTGPFATVQIRRLSRTARTSSPCWRPGPRAPFVTRWGGGRSLPIKKYYQFIGTLTKFPSLGESVNDY